MPLYEYECDACGQRFEVIQKFSDPPPDVCANCGKGPVRRLLSSPAIQFKGTGWYITDYAQKGKSPADGSAAKSDASEKAGAEKSGAEKSGAEKTGAEKTGAAKTDKTEAKTEKKSDASSSATSSSSAKT